MICVKKYVLAGIIAAVFTGAALPAQQLYYPGAPRQWTRSFYGGGEETEYQKGLRALDARNWLFAEEVFSRLAERHGSAADAALYWKAYAENRSGKRQAALDTIAELRSQWSGSRWMRDAEALELELRAHGGQAVSLVKEPDTDVKLLAIDSLLLTKPSVAVPALRGVLEGNNPPALKDRALFVLTQSASPEAHKLVASVARDGKNDEVRYRAIQYLGMLGGREARTELESIYKNEAKTRTRQAVLQGLAFSGSRDFLLEIAKADPNGEMRNEAVMNLLRTGGGDDVWKLYDSSSSTEEKAAILKAMFWNGNGDRLVGVARDEKNERLRVAAVRSLGMMGATKGHGEALTALFKREASPAMRNAILMALFMQGDAQGLVSLARSEKDPRKKAEIMKQLSRMPSDEVSRYAIELLK